MKNLRYQLDFLVLVRPSGFPRPDAIFPGFLIPRELLLLGSGEHKVYFDSSDLSKMNREEIVLVLRREVRRAVEAVKSKPPGRFRLSSEPPEETMENSKVWDPKDGVWRPYGPTELGVTQIIVFEEKGSGKSHVLSLCGVECCILVEAIAKRVVRGQGGR